jgi:hypothetical protein
MRATNINPNDAATSRGRRKSTAASSRGVSEREVDDIRVNSADMIPTPGRYTTGGLYEDPQIVSYAIENLLQTFLSKLHRIHIPTQTVRRNKLADL